MNFVNPDIVPVTCREEEVSFRSGEFVLAGRLFLPALPPKVIVVINSATGVPAPFYGAFARWLAESKGYACLTYDYRGFGASGNGQKGRMRFSDWAVYDAEAARAFAKSRFPDAKLWVIGHSVGALGLPFQDGLDDMDRVIAVASGFVHTSDHPWSYRPLASLFWYGHVPLIVAALGRLPAWAGLGADVPGPVYWQWRRWCTKRSGFAQEFGTSLPYPDWTGLKAPIKFVAVDDDPMVPPPVVWRLMQCHPRARKTQLLMKPADYGLNKIGHIHAFAARNKACWDDLIA
ncbi:MAG: alpha/beta fold hydrolase [Pseudomonadota bacterium]